VAAVERALALDPDGVAANVAAGSIYQILGFRTDEQHYLVLAERALSRDVDLAPSDPEVLRPYGSLLAQLGRWQTAIEVTERGVAFGCKLCCPASRPTTGPWRRGWPGRVRAEQRFGPGNSTHGGPEAATPRHTWCGTLAPSQAIAGAL
jgi:hypothetical protein